VTGVKNYLAGVENPSPGAESGSLASAESIPGPIIANALATWVKSARVLGAMILALKFC
jgi:hypothetical protein